MVWYTGMVTSYAKLMVLSMEEIEKEVDEDERRQVAVETAKKISVGTKVLLTAIVIGAAVAGAYFAISISQ